MHQARHEPDDEERALWSAFKRDGSGTARERLFAIHAAFARGIARRLFRQRSLGDIDPLDLQQHAYTGLLEALDRFDPDRGVPFRPFAAHRIEGSIRDGIVHMSEAREQMSWRHRVQRERIASLHDPGQDTADTAQAMARLADIAVGLAIGFMLEDTGLYVDEHAASASPLRATAYDSLAWKQIVVQLQAEMNGLPARERDILRHHYIDGVGFDQLAVLLGVSKGRVSQLHRSALDLLRKRLRQKGQYNLGI